MVDKKHTVDIISLDFRTAFHEASPEKYFELQNVVINIEFTVVYIQGQGERLELLCL